MIFDGRVAESSRLPHNYQQYGMNLQKLYQTDLYVKEVGSGLGSGLDRQALARYGSGLPDPDLTILYGSENLAKGCTVPIEAPCIPVCSSLRNACVLPDRPLQSCQPAWFLTPPQASAFSSLADLTQNQCSGYGYVNIPSKSTKLKTLNRKYFLLAS
jgi:hypothetical protein